MEASEWVCECEPAGCAPPRRDDMGAELMSPSSTVARGGGRKSDYDFSFVTSHFV